MGKYEQLIYNHLHLSHTLDQHQQIFKCGLACHEGQLADAEIAALKTAIRETLEENPHLADGDNCTLIKLKRVINEGK